MKKKILGVTLIVTLAVVAAFNINLNKSNNKGELILANVEALAEAEGGGWNWQCETGSTTAFTYQDCFMVQKPRIITTTFYCSPGVYGTCKEGYQITTVDCYGNSQVGDPVTVTGTCS